MFITSFENTTSLNWTEDLTLQNIETFKDHMKKLIQSEGHQLILNLKEVNYINSSALGIIADSVLEARKHHKEIVIVEIQPVVIEIFTIVKFSTFIKLFDTQEEAFQYFKEAQ